MEQRLRSELQEDQDRLYTRLEQLERRVDALEQRWEVEAQDQLKSVETKAESLALALNSIRNEQTIERKSRLKREGRLLEQVEATAKEFEELWQHEREDRVAKLTELDHQITGHEERLLQKQREYEERIDEELAALQNELALEIQERKAGDDEIVSALNRHTEQMQRNLSML
jgi:hypothetical protein